MSDESREDLRENLQDEGQGRTQSVTVRMPPELVKKIDLIAQEEHRSRSSVVTEACDIYVNAASTGVDLARVAELERFAQHSIDYERLIELIANRVKKDLEQGAR